MLALPFLSYSLLLALLGYGIHAIIGGRWVEARNVHKFGDPRHLWITIRGTPHALTDDQLAVSSTRAQRLQDSRGRYLAVVAWILALVALSLIALWP